MKNILFFACLLLVSCTKVSEVNTNEQLKDIDGNQYHSIIIGTQEWMVENLSTTKLNDGTNILEITDNLEWVNTKSPAYCWLNNDVPTDLINGALYNFYVVNSNKLCPTGWHVPSDGEWKTFEMYLGMSQNEADMIKWRGDGISTLLKALEGWYCLNGIQDNYGFKAMPSGARNGYQGDFFNGAAWWTSTKYDDDNAWSRSICDELTTIFRSNTTSNGGYSVRCIKTSN